MSFGIRLIGIVRSLSGKKGRKMEEMIEKKTPKGRLDEQGPQKGNAEKDPLTKWPGGVNPNTGESGGPAGPEPTRYGDWERKGRISDF